MLNLKGRSEGNSQFLFDGKTFLVSFKVKKNRVISHLSSMHEEKSIPTSRKPPIVEHYNQTKGGVDAFDQVAVP